MPRAPLKAPPGDILYSYQDVYGILLFFGMHFDCFSIIVSSIFRFLVLHSHAGPKVPFHVTLARTRGSWGISRARHLASSVRRFPVLTIQVYIYIYIS